MKALKFTLLMILSLLLSAFMLACDEKSEPPKDEPTPISMTLDSLKTEFAWGEEFSNDGIKVNVKYSDGTVKEAGIEDYITDVTEYKKDSAGTYKITIILGDTGIQKSYYVNVAAPLLETVSVTGMKSSYKCGESFSEDGIKVTFGYEDGTVRDAAIIEYMVDSADFKSDIPGTYTIRVLIKGTSLIETFKVTVEESA